MSSRTISIGSKFKTARKDSCRFLFLEECDLKFFVYPWKLIVLSFRYMFPRTLLSHHFWSLQQRSEFSMIEHKEKLTYFRPVFRSLQAQLRSVKVSTVFTKKGIHTFIYNLFQNQPEHKSWSNVLGLIGSGVHPSPQLLLDCIHLFEDKPYNLSSLTAYHIVSPRQIHSSAIINLYFRDTS